MDYFDESVKYKRGEDWYNPGFLEDVDGLSDVTTREIYDCLSAHTISSFISKLKTKTKYDAQIDTAYSQYSDWPN